MTQVLSHIKHEIKLHNVKHAEQHDPTIVEQCNIELKILEI